MAIYHVKIERGGGYSVEAEINMGGRPYRSGKFMAKDKAELRTQTQNLGVMVKNQRLALKGLTLAQVNRGEEKS
jgi:hypothetical protein